jgi:hypothetical protein
MKKQVCWLTIKERGQQGRSLPVLPGAHCTYGLSGGSRGCIPGGAGGGW